MHALQHQSMHGGLRFQPHVFQKDAGAGDEISDSNGGLLLWSFSVWTQFTT
jgi:hypothetical protein